MEIEAKKTAKQPQKQSKRRKSNSEEVTSLEWEVIQISDQEEDLIHRMHRLVGDRWDLIAGRIPGRTAVEIERFWILKHGS
ncbi:transcription factor CPC-like [Benincasa hispida]|uniref:transcription factor CPC-like n=1 Tax=Benincasa hispida TaxID=102211 RepID=UPI0019029245|nr:transcription factor CPC-like [Benincasa hispida]